jgi:hypothetical protein
MHIMSNASQGISEQMYKTKMSAVNMESHEKGEIIEEKHSRSEIIERAKETQLRNMGLEFCSFAGLKEVTTPDEAGDKAYYVNKAGKRVEFTKEMQFKAAIAVLNAQGHYFEATPMN